MIKIRQKSEKIRGCANKHYFFQKSAPPSSLMVPGNVLRRWCGIVPVSLTGTTGSLQRILWMGMTYRIGFLYSRARIPHVRQQISTSLYNEIRNNENNYHNTYNINNSNNINNSTNIIATMSIVIIITIVGTVQQEMGSKIAAHPCTWCVR